MSIVLDTDKIAEVIGNILLMVFVFSALLFTAIFGRDGFEMVVIMHEFK